MKKRSPMNNVQAMILILVLILSFAIPLLLVELSRSDKREFDRAPLIINDQHVHSPQSTGINVVCKKVFGQWLITDSPFCILNETEKKYLSWDVTFIPLEPNKTYRIKIGFPYMKGETGVSTFAVNLKPGEIQYYVYRTPLWMWQKGKIKRIM
jgi:hypothetical protein